MRNLYPTKSEIKNVILDIITDGKAVYKNITIVRDSCFHDSENIVFADNIEELLFDINEFQSVIDYDNNIK